MIDGCTCCVQRGFLRCTLQIQSSLSQLKALTPSHLLAGSLPAYCVDNGGSGLAFNAIDPTVTLLSTSLAPSLLLSISPWLLGPPNHPLLLHSLLSLPPRGLRSSSQPISLATSRSLLTATCTATRSRCAVKTSIQPHSPSDPTNNTTLRTTSMKMTKTTTTMTWVIWC